MKLHYTKILLFVLQLNILLTSYHAHNKNKAYITHHKPRYASRVLSEGDTQSSIYNNDADMISVKENFERQTSERLREYDKRLQVKRQKRKEERDKNIQKIIEKNKMEKSLAEKVEKGCLRCGCGLGGGVLPVWGLVSGLWYATLSQHVTKMAIQKGIEAGIKEGLAQIKNIFETSGRSGVFPGITVEKMLSSGKFTNGVNLYDMAKHINTMYDKFPDSIYNQFWSQIHGIVNCETIDVFNARNSTRIAAVANAFENGKAAEVSEFASHTSLLSNTIIASAVTILVIVLVMIIIYLILRYRRKKKMNKKAQYTKLLNQ
ncbi:rifin [Plasmodium reichenowi]|uniref:Rifin n=1 Tax=Plasmodium reichenowi TaxID=5854 RepID=A0A060RMD0_PLARE|nr:rifin [Plasmodium reichenowi]